MYFLSLFLVWGLLTGPGIVDPTPSPAPATVYEFDNEASTMTVYGTSNVRDWTMDVTQINGTVTAETSTENLPSIQSVTLEVPVEQMTSEKDRLQRHAHEALHKEEYPTITFSASDIDVSSTPTDSFSVVATGELTIKGQTRSVELTAKGIQNSDGTLAVRGEQELKLSTYDVERPSLMFGAIKVDDPIRIGFETVLRPSSQASSAK